MACLRILTGRARTVVSGTVLEAGRGVKMKLRINRIRPAAGTAAGRLAATLS